MNEIRADGGFTQAISSGKYVGIQVMNPDTVILLFQRPGPEANGTLTTMLPISVEAFYSLIALGEDVKRKIEMRIGR